MNEYKGLSKKDLLAFLVAERQYHFEHPQAVNLKVLITVATTAIGLITASSLFEDATSGNGWALRVAVGFVVVGLVLAMILYFVIHSVSQKSQAGSRSEEAASPSEASG